MWRGGEVITGLALVLPTAALACRGPDPTPAQNSATFPPGILELADKVFTVSKTSCLQSCYRPEKTPRNLHNLLHLCR